MEINAFPDKIIDLGYKGEEEERIIVFDLSFFDDFNLSDVGGFYELFIEQNGKIYKKNVITNHKKKKVYWKISDENNDRNELGNGKCQLVYKIGNIIIKSLIYEIEVNKGEKDLKDKKNYLKSGKNLFSLTEEEILNYNN